MQGCGRGHEARLLARQGFDVVGIDFSAEAVKEARRLDAELANKDGTDRIHQESGTHCRWVQADVLDPASLTAAGIATGRFRGVLEHTCYCAIDPALRETHARTMVDLIAPGGWLLGLFRCHPRSGGPPFGSDSVEVARQLEGAGFVRRLWEPAQHSQPGRDNEWLGLWRRP